MSALLFDLDGTLIDSRPAAERVWKNWSKRHGIPWEAVEAVLHGRRAIDTMRLLAPHLPQPEAVDRLTDDEVADTDGVVPIAGAAKFLAHLPRNRWAIVTSCPRRLAIARLNAAGLALPDVMICAEDVMNGKPAPDCYLMAAARLGVPAKDCLVFEDAPSGFEAARRAGMKFIAVAPHGIDDRTALFSITDYEQLKASSREADGAVELSFRGLV